MSILKYPFNEKRTNDGWREIDTILEKSAM
jgi:hypothetical protein